MGKKVKKKGKRPAKDKQISNHVSSKKVGESTNMIVESANVVVSTDKKRKSCPHLEQGVNLEKLSIKIGSSDPIKCESCREVPLDRRVTRGKGKQGRKGVASGDSRSDSKEIWVCLECGHYSCGGVELPVTPHCHAGRHARQDRHHLVVLFGKTLLCWCFSCNMLIPIEKLEKDGKGSNVLSEVVKLIKGRPPELSADTEDVGLESPSGSGVLLDASLTQDPFEREVYVVRGLVNLGNTCFFNSVIQNLLAMDSLCDKLLQVNSDGAVTSAFKKLIIETCQRTGPQSIINPRALFGAVCLKAPQFKGFQQQDSHELLRCLLDGLSTEELAMRKQMGASKEDTVTSTGNTFVDTLFGGKISSTVRCCECGHSSTVYEPFLDLSLPVPTKKPVTKAQQLSRTKKAKLPPKKSGRMRSKVNKDVDNIPGNNLSSQLTSTELSSHVHPVLPVNRESTELCGVARLLSSTNTTSGDDEKVVNSSTSSSVQNLTQVLENTNEENLASFSWMDYLENGTESEENDLTSGRSYPSLIQDVKKEDISSDESLAGVGTEFSCQVVPKLPHTAEVVAFSGCSTSQSCAENASKGEFVSEKYVSSQEMEAAHIIPNYDEKMSATSDSLLWLDHIEPATLSEKSDLPLENNYMLVPAAENMGIPPEEVSGSGRTESIGQKCLQNNDPILDINSSSLNCWDEEAPFQIQGSQVLLLPYKEESSIAEDKNGGVGEASSSSLGWGKEESEFEGIGDLFNEPEVVAGPSNRPCCSSEITESAFLAGQSVESDPDEVDDTDSPVSVESCLNFFVKPELLSNENAWHCENCAKVLLDKKLEAKKQRIRSSMMIYGENITQCIENNIPAEAQDISERHIKSNIVEKSSNFSDKVVDCPDKNGVKLTKCSTGYVEVVDGHKENEKCEKPDSFVQEFQTLGLNDDCNTDNQGSRCTLQVLHQNNESEDFEDEVVHCKSVEVKRNATKSVFIHKAPSILTIHLKRFSQDARGRFSKLNGHVRFGETIDLRPYVDSRSLYEEKLHYRLVGVVEHLGSMRGGHYVAYVRGGRKSRGHTEKEVEGCVWYHASDTYIREVTLDEVLRNEAYILFYEKT